MLSLTLSGGLAQTTHSTDLQQSQQILDCGPLASASDVRPYLELGLLVPINTWLSVGGSLGYFDRGAGFSRSNTYPLRATDGTESTLSTAMNVDAALSYIEIAPVASIPVIGTAYQPTLSVFAGPRIALPVATRYVHTERVVSPTGGFLVVNGQRTTERTIDDASLTSRSGMLVGLTLGVTAAIPLSERLNFAPSVQYDNFSTSILTDAPWNISAFRVSFGVQYNILSAAPRPAPEAPPVPPSAPPPAVRMEPPVLAVRGMRFDGEVRTGSRLVATPPILNAVFFDSSSASIPATYLVERSTRFSQMDAVAAHAFVLMRIANVLTANPNGSVALVGATSGSMNEPEGLALATRRANAVRLALEGLGVAPERITVSATMLPRVPSNQDFPEGRAENRRVDIVVSDAPLQEWVSSTQYAELHGQLEVDVLTTSGKPSMVTVDGQVAEVRNGTGAVRVPIVQRLSEQQSVASISVRTTSGNLERVVDTTITVARLPRREVNLQTETFDAILRFDYNSSVLNADVKSLLSQLALRLPAGRTIVVSGSADMLGTDQRNKELTEQRAKATAEYLQDAVAGRNPTVIEAAPQRFSDATPQGRFLNRSIRITTR